MIAYPPTYEEARANAVAKAMELIDKQIFTLFNSLQEKSGEAQIEYDDQTDGGDIARKQTEWELNWQQYIRQFQW